MITVLLNDENSDLDYNRMRLYFIDAAIWAVKHCPSYVRYNILDVSDNSAIFDQIAEYKFRDERDALIFELKWRR